MKGLLRILYKKPLLGFVGFHRGRIRKPTRSMGLKLLMKSKVLMGGLETVIRRAFSRVNLGLFRSSKLGEKEFL